MDIQQASDGGLFLLERQLEEYDSLDNLLEDVGQLTGVTSNNVLLFMEDGRELKTEILEEAWNTAGPSSPSAAQRLKLYLFNRETFWSDAEQWAVQFQEDVILPPPLDPNQAGSLAHIQHPFLVAHDHLSHLQSLYQAQSRALEIAYSNLSHHLQPLINEFEKFSIRAEKELQNEESLIKGAKVDMALLPKLSINPALLRKKKEAEGDERIKTIGDFVNKRKMEQVRDSCRTAHEEHVDRYNTLAGQLDELALQSDAEMRAFMEQSEAVGREFTEGLARLEVAISQLSELLGSGAEDVAQDLVELDQAMRDDLIALTGVKNEFTLEIHLHLRQVAQFQSRITQIIGPLAALDADLRDKVAFPHLHRLRQLPFAYASVVAEVVRRKEYSRLLLEWTLRLSEALSRFTSTEKTRREQVQVEMISQLPFGIVGLEENGPRVDISVITGADGLSGLKFGQEEIEKLVLWVESLKVDEEILSALEEGDENYLSTLQASIESLNGKVDFASDELDRIIERSVLSSRDKPRSASNSRMTLNLSTQLRTANQEKVEQEKRFHEMEEAHQARLRELEDQYQQRLAVSQTRQAELQDELVRLRTDLSEEMLARQALSAELEERSREQEEKYREQEDQSEFIKGLHAELTQEKDRATDLGVRLQEALLDVDGLKSAEQTLITQLQELQEERTTHLQNMGEAQLTTQGLESQLAGLRAELDATSQQLAEAQSDRDLALKNQSAEAERMMRDHIAETDGDRAVLEHQNLTLTKQLEDKKVEVEEKVNAVKNSAIRQVDGLKAELSFTKAQLREVQRKETVLIDELAMAKDSAMAISQEKLYQSDVSKDSIALVTKYHEACSRLLNAINNSTTISGSIGGTQSQVIVNNNSIIKSQPLSNSITPNGNNSNKDELRESVMIRSLETAQNLDLVVFSEAVTKTIGLVKKWSKSCRQFRDLAKNKISFTNFAKGDLALFLPTRNAAARSWAAFNISAPHNFLKVTDAMQEQIKTREWIIARIVKTDEAIASGGDAPETNPFGLADGLRYYTHHVEEYNPHAIRPSRRSTSASLHPNTEKDTSISQMLSSTHRTPGVTEPISSVDMISPTKTPRSRPRAGSGYFPPMTVVSEKVKESEEVSDSPEPDDETSLETKHDQNNSIAENNPVIVESPDQQGKEQEVADSTNTKSEIGISTSTSTPLPPVLTSSPTVPLPSSQPIPPRKTHSRLPSRGTTPVSPPLGSTRENLIPGSLGRPSSVASSSAASSYPKGLTIGPSSGKGTLAPAMATNTSTDSSSVSTGGGEDKMGTIRRKESSSHLGSPEQGMVRPSPLGGERSRRGSRNQGRGSLEGFRGGSGSGSGSGSESGSISPTNLGGIGGGSGGFNALGTGTGTGTDPTANPSTSASTSTSTASKLIRGFSIGRKSSLNKETTPPSGIDGATTTTKNTERRSSGKSGSTPKPSAMDMLKRFESGSNF
ncbi:hypothetical protein I302_100765 [Kwoniella bestiolae CBS 10118]|uniref:Autophagy-related protein 11 n=1 Tax=Kwoniella bestiolae CBS 10118 TaxID=1296100 RepID=A0A1B9G619_9TREE|nr:hypothetical protein I302_04138 [Kwoniella bestiolae CBS 10118]OCF26453.1 hypothetical protein I302_04138 [Kwoniella bestiolae CBS 10118]